MGDSEHFPGVICRASLKLEEQHRLSRDERPFSRRYLPGLIEARHTSSHNSRSKLHFPGVICRASLKQSKTPRRARPRHNIFPALFAGPH